MVVADRETMTPQYRLPVLDVEGNYSNWGLGPMALPDDGTVLLPVEASVTFAQATLRQVGVG